MRETGTAGDRLPGSSRVTPPAGLVMAGFAAYGALWGPYLAALPEIRVTAGADTGQLGFAMLLGAVAALPAMAWVGRLLDRFGRPAGVSALLFFAVSAVTPMWAGSVPVLIGTVALFGFGSGACNVVMVALAAAAEASGPKVMNRAHALFSVGVLVGSAVTGLAGSPRAVAAALAAGLAGWVLAARSRFPSRLTGDRRAGGKPVRPMLWLCLLAGLAMLVESGVQQWSSVFLSDVVGATRTWSAAAPGIFAGGMALGRLGGHWLSARVPERTVLVAAGLAAGAGVLLVATAGTQWHGLAGVAAVGAGVSVVTPTSYALAVLAARPGERGASIGATASLANLGLLLGPALVGQIAGHSDLRTAMAALVVACGAVCLLALRVSRFPGYR